MNTPTITILGTGYVGLTTAALFAAAGIKTFVVDPNESRLAAVSAGKSFFYEEGLDPLVAQGFSSGLLVPTSSYVEAVPGSDVVISAVGTPDNPDGSSNLTYIFAAAKEAAQHMRPGAVFVQKSTVPIGTGRKVMEIFAKAGAQVAYVSNPEFLRESTALRDSLWFDRIVVGGTDAAALEKVMAVYKIVEEHRDDIAKIAGLAAPTKPQVGRYITTTLESAELIKVTSNAFLALKISFANSIAQLADKAGADVNEVMDGAGADARIVRAFLNAGRGYGGGCFPKDVSGLIASGLAHGVDLKIMRAAQSVNDEMPGYIIEKLQDAAGGSLVGKTVAVLGLAFKAGTSDTRKSSGIALANTLVGAGATVVAFDPKAIEEARHTLDESVVVEASLDEALASADVALVATDWPEFVSLTPESYAQKMAGSDKVGSNKILVDAMNRFDPAAVKAAGLCYIGVGRA